MPSRTQSNRRSNRSQGGRAGGRSNRSSRTTRAARSTRGARTTRTTRAARSSRGGGTGRRASTSSRGGNARGGRASGRRPAARQDSLLKQVQPNVEEAEELILQALETELGGVQVYQAAVNAAQNEELREEWEKYLEQTRHHVEVVQELIQKLNLDAEKETPGREIVRHLGKSLVQAIETARQGGKPEHAEIVAAECVTLAETKDHLNWTLLGELGKTGFEWADAIQEACDEVEDEEDEHLYHTMGWTRELWIQGLGLPAAVPPPEEERDVKSMAAAARAKAERQQYVESEN